jgi:hypothetical protein
MKKLLIIFLFLLLSTSCGKKGSSISSLFNSRNDSLSTNTQNQRDNLHVSEHNCIENKLNRDLDGGESIAKMTANTDITFCNGIHLRLKTYQFVSKKYKAYGFIESNSGRESCIQDSSGLTHNKLFGDHGVLVSDSMKILLGGHRFDADNNLVPSDHFIYRNVRFDWGSYTGEMAFYENGKVRCWAIQ